MNTPTLWLGEHQVVIDDPMANPSKSGYIKVRRIDGGIMGYFPKGHNAYTDIVHTDYLVVRVG
jgi:hypothetical protein